MLCHQERRMEFRPLPMSPWDFEKCVSGADKSVGGSKKSKRGEVARSSSGHIIFSARSADPFLVGIYLLLLRHKTGHANRNRVFTKSSLYETVLLLTRNALARSSSGHISFRTRSARLFSWEFACYYFTTNFRIAAQSVTGTKSRHYETLSSLSWV